MTKVLTPILLFIISVGLFFSYIKPTWEATEKFQDLKVTLEEATKKYKQLGKEIEDARTVQLTVLGAHNTTMMEILPDSINVVRFLMDIQKIVKEHNLTLESFSLPPIERRLEKALGEEINVVKSKDVTIMLEGEYDNVKKLLQTVESSKTLTDIVSIAIEKKENKAKTGYILQYHITMRLYWLN